MSITSRPSNTEHTSYLLTSRRAIATFIIGSAVMVGVSGCGQKGDLYLAESSSQTVEGSSSVLNSTSNPQDAAFAGIDDDTYQKNDYLDEQQLLPEPSTDPNDY
ncbi:lipoprotein [Psychrobacter sp. PP-21]|uniref:LPS translocon maturation chaperone LptM n=1 Tax=Psychrobacter sp. PP-21 TaxID=2957503 RepID=UPI0029BA76A7|nr:lipoprotein [Psychrobacter sp. PP-21]MDX2373855.1 lipoprotein [Psychrobacter sp. PP-21]